MPNIEEQLEKKKGFKKKRYRSYLSLDETLDDLSPSLLASVEPARPAGTVIPAVPAESTVPANTAAAPKPISAVVLAVSADTTATANSAATAISTVAAKSTAPLRQPTVADGFTRVSHRILETLYLADLNPRQFRVLLFVLRKSLGWGHEEVELSTKDFSEALGMDSAGIWRAIPGLIKDGFLLKREGDTQKNIYALNSQKFGVLIPAKSAVTANSTVPAASTAEPTVTLTVASNCRSDSYLHGQEPLPSRQPGDLKIGLNKEIKKSLSLSNFPDTWNEFLTQLTERERERASRVFKNLKTQFPDDPIDEIAECPRNLERFGAPDGTPWAKIKSPIGLMESSWPQIRDFFRTHLAAEKRVKLARDQAMADQATANTEAERAAQEDAMRDQAFAEAFPTDEARQEAFVKYIALSGLGRRPDSKMGKHTAMARWWSETKDNAESLRGNSP